jgi:hypothetical protein
MNDRPHNIRRILLLLAVFGGLFLLYPPVLAFAELAARELRFLWWLVLLVALGLWLIFGMKKRE